ncbi:NACHT domain-containing protein [Streptomyces sp. NPDC020917]|uniref:NACHT domain-containing protein n=1 Tax=Streptomyces sp. NPDC020917 TaxID=3365102 RepID=UPI0037960B60
MAEPAAGTGPLRERLAVVRCGGRQGSGYLLGPRLVLTAAHLVEGGEGAADARVTVPGGPGETVCARAWSRRHDPSGIDAALLAAPVDLAPPGLFPQAGDRWAQIVSLGTVPGCDAVGFPYVQRDAAGRLDSEQLTGTYKPGSGLFTGRDVLTLDGTPPAPRPDGHSPLAGLSGTAVFARGVLLGVITTDPAGWQHGRVTVTPLYRLLEEDDFLAALTAHRVAPPRLAPPPGQLVDEAAEFEPRYGAYVAKRHGTLRIFGIDVGDRSRATWPLDAAYYSLEAAPSAAAGNAWRSGGVLGGAEGSGSLPAEQALAGRDRVLLRGVAGSGKSTLVQWLAVAAARQDLGEHLGHLRDTVPYVLPLRTLARRDRLPAPGGFLGAVDVPMTAPDGWAEQVLREGRGLVLVDGLDEIDERARERVGDWLRGLLAAYPGNRWLVTSRPSAVADAWLADEGFTELTLSPMNRADVQAFTARWHDAVRGTVRGDTAELARLDGYERSLLQALHAKQDLARLATNPLMCGLICALHRDRGGYLPTGRKELYDAALAMLLVRRDQERDLAPLLTEAPQVQLLQKLAYWLVRNRQAEMDTADAVALIGAALPAMPAVAALGDAGAVHRYLLGRSGLIREPAAGSVDFIHRTFQDYLAAKAAVEERDFDLMTRNAHHDQWADVIRMAVAHARPGERARLLRKIVTRGDRTKSHRARLHLLAMACLEHATELDPEVRRLVEDRGAALIPPRTYPEAEELAAVGPMVLELLPGPGELADDDARAVVQAAHRVGGDAAVPLLARFAGHADAGVRSPLAQFPHGADCARYAAEVLDRLPRAETLYVAESADELRALAELGGVTQVRTAGALSATALLAGIGDPQQLTKIHLGPAVTDAELAALCALPRLAELMLLDASRITDLSPLGRRALRKLWLYELPRPLDLAGLAGLGDLEFLAVDGQERPWPGLSTLPQGLPLKELYTPYGMDGFDGIEHVPGLVHLGCHSPFKPLLREDWARLAGLAALESLALSTAMFDHLDPGFPPLPGIRRLSLTAQHELPPLDGVDGLFPGLEEISLLCAHRPPDTIDLLPLAGLAELASVTIRDPVRGLTLLNADALPPKATVTFVPRPRT